MRVSFRGSKPEDLELPEHIALDIYGDLFWAAMESKFSSFVTNIFRLKRCSRNVSVLGLRISFWKKFGKNRKQKEPRIIAEQQE